MGGTSALSTAGRFLARNGIETIYLPDLTWANHHLIFNYAGLHIGHYPYYNKETHRLNFSGLCEALQRLPSGSVVLLHACCHNPTGYDPSPSQWEELSHLFKRQQLIPFFDIAYQGFGAGLNEDAYAIRCFAQEGQEMLIASSFAKNLGLYGERVGLLAVL